MKRGKKLAQVFTTNGIVNVKLQKGGRTYEIRHKHQLETLAVTTLNSTHNLNATVSPNAIASQSQPHVAHTSNTLNSNNNNDNTNTSSTNATPQNNTNNMSTAATPSNQPNASNTQQPQTQAPMDQHTQIHSYISYILSYSFTSKLLYIPGYLQFI